MRNHPTIDVLAAAVTASVVVLSIWLSASGQPPLDRRLHRAIGRALGKEATSILTPHTRITVVTRDTEAFPQPALEFLMKGLEDELRASRAVIATKLLIQIDALRPNDVPPGDFFEALRRAKTNDVIISLLGPPLLTDAQRQSLGPNKARVIAFGPGSAGEIIDWAKLFGAGLLHAAVVSRPLATMAREPLSKAKSFEDLYLVWHASDFAIAPALSGLIRTDAP